MSAPDADLDGLGLTPEQRERVRAIIERASAAVPGIDQAIIAVLRQDHRQRLSRQTRAIAEEWGRRGGHL